MTRWLFSVGLLWTALACGGNGTQLAAQDAQSSPGEAEARELLPVGIRRLTNREFRKTASAVLGVEVKVDFEARLPPDVRQEDGYTRNVDQTLSGALAVNLEQMVPELVQRALEQRGSRLFPCAEAPYNSACVGKWIEDHATLAFRQRVTPVTLNRLRELFRRGHATGSANEGAALVLTALLLSPELWYVRELGETNNATQRGVSLTPYEIADQIGFVMRGTPADPPLLAAAKAGTLSDPNERRAHARRLLALPDSREHYREFVLSWLEVDQLNNTGKSETVFERYEDFKPRMLAETENFVDEVFVSEGASAAKLLDGGFVSVDPQMAVFYGLKEYGPRVDGSTVGRYGVLQQASFLASHSHADTTSPVLRGDFVLRKVLCQRLPRPSELDIEVIMPRPSETITRREQFARHGADPRCADCHDQLDGFGLVFEAYDAAGRYRELELKRPVRTDGKVMYQGRQWSFANSRQLVSWLVARPETSECFARQLFRFVTGRVQPGAEEAFLRLRHELPEHQRNNVLEHLVTYVGSPNFAMRRKP